MKTGSVNGGGSKQGLTFPLLWAAFAFYIWSYPLLNADLKTEIHWKMEEHSQNVLLKGSGYMHKTKKAL